MAVADEEYLSQESSSSSDNGFEGPSTRDLRRHQLCRLENLSRTAILSEDVSIRIDSLLSIGFMAKIYAFLIVDKESFGNCRIQGSEIVRSLVKDVVRVLAEAKLTLETVSSLKLYLNEDYSKSLGIISEDVEGHFLDILQRIPTIVPIVAVSPDPESFAPFSMELFARE